MRKSLSRVFKRRKESRRKEEDDNILAVSTRLAKDVDKKIEKICSDRKVEALDSSINFNTISSKSEDTMPSEKSDKDKLLGSQVGQSVVQKRETANGAVAAIESSEPTHGVTSYDEVPILDQTKLPRGGVSVDTKAVGRVQVCIIAKNLGILIFI